MFAYHYIKISGQIRIEIKIFYMNTVNLRTVLN